MTVKRGSRSPTDVHVGEKIRMLRMLVGISMEKLGEALGLTYQQVQKYEKGANRIGAGRLQQIANILKVPVASLFEGGPDSPKSALQEDLSITLSANEVRLVVAFRELTESNQTLALVLVRAAVDHQKNPEL